MANRMVENYLSIREKIKEQAKILCELRKEEKQINKDILEYINQSNDTGMQLNDHTVIRLVNVDKPINKNKKDYQSALENLCFARGISDETFVKDVMSAKIKTVVQQQKLVISKPEK